MPSNHLILCHPLLLLPSIFPSIRVFSNESALCIKWPKYWSFSFSISPSNEYSGLISFRMDWLDLLAVQGTVKSHLQHHSLKASILWCSAFFMVQLSQPYMSTTTFLLSIQKYIFLSKTQLLNFFFPWKQLQQLHFYWSTVNLQCCVCLGCTAKWSGYSYIYIVIYTHIYTYYFSDYFPL